MDEEVKQPSAPAQEGGDDIKNIKAEFDRKLSNVTADLKKQNEALLAQIRAMAAPPKPAEQKPKKLEDVWFDKPDETAKTIVNEAVDTVRKELRQQQEAQAKQQATIASLVRDFPELSQPDHSLTTRAVEIYDAMSDDEKASPVAYRAAVKEAALELGVKPKSKRSSEGDDSFSLSGGTPSKTGAQKKADIDQRTLLFAEAIGVKLDDEAKKRIANKHGRKSYNNWG